MATAGAGRIAAKTVDAETAQTAGIVRAGIADFRLARARAVARDIHPGTRADVVLSIGGVGAGPERSSYRTRYARSRTDCIATNAVDANTAQAVGGCGASLTVLFFADPIAVAGLVYPGTCGHTIGVVQTGGDVGASTDSAGDATGFARPAAHGVAANAVEALTADAFAAGCTRLPIVGFACAEGVASFVAVAYVGGHVVFAPCERRADAQAAHDIAGIAGRGAGRGATNAVDAEIADAFRREAAPLRIVFLAHTRAITRVCPRASGQVLDALRHVDALAYVARHVARFARIPAGRIATNAVDTETAQAIPRGGTRIAIVDFANTRAIANGPAHLHTRGIHRLGRIRRYALHAATVLRASITVHGLVVRIDRFDDIAHGVTFQYLAIFGGLVVGGIGARRRQGQTALLIDARTRFAEVVRGQIDAIRRGETPDTLAVAVTNERIAAGHAGRDVRIRRHPVRADIFRARIVVLGNVDG